MKLTLLFWLACLGSVSSWGSDVQAEDVEVQITVRALDAPVPARVLYYLRQTSGSSWGAIDQGVGRIRLDSAQPGSLVVYATGDARSDSQGLAPRFIDFLPPAHDL